MEHPQFSIKGRGVLLNEISPSYGQDFTQPRTGNVYGEILERLTLLPKAN